MVFLQSRQSLVSWQSGLTRWNDSLRKRLGNIYLISMTHRIETRRFPWNNAFILRFPFAFRNPLRFKTYGKSRLYEDNGSNVNKGSSIRFSPVAVFRRYTNSMEGVIKSANDMRFPVDRNQRGEIFDPLQIRFLHTVNNAALKENKGTISFPQTGRKPVPDRFIVSSIKSYQRTALKSHYVNMNYSINAYSGMAGGGISAYRRDRSNSDQIEQNVISIKPYQKMTLKESPGDRQYDRTGSGPVKDLINYKRFKRKFTERTGKLSLSHTGRTLIVTQDTVRSMKPYKRVVFESSQRDLKYGDSRNDRINPGMTGSLISDQGRFIASMDQINMNYRRNYSGENENINPHEANDTIKPFVNDGLKPIRQKDLPVVPFRYEGVNYVQADTIYAIPSLTQAWTKSAGGRFNSILTSDRTQKFSGPLSLTSASKKPLYNITRTEDPFSEKKEQDKTGASIDYNKVADRVYEILTRRIIREKERMGELV